MKLIDYKRGEWRDIPLIPGDNHGPSIMRERDHVLKAVAAKGDFDWGGPQTMAGRYNLDDYAELQVGSLLCLGWDWSLAGDAANVTITLRECSIPWSTPMKLYNGDTMEVIGESARYTGVRFADFLPRIPAEMLASVDAKPVTECRTYGLGKPFKRVPFIR